MKNLKTFNEFVNESKLNEGYTVSDYIRNSKSFKDEESVKVAETILKMAKLKASDMFWITNEDDDDKFDEIEEYWDENSKPVDVSKKLTGEDEPAGRGSYWAADLKIPMFKYEEQGLECYVIPIKIYNKI